MQRELNSCFVNNYFYAGLKALPANMDIQAVLNEYRAVTYYFSKTEDSCSQAMKQAAKEFFENKMDHDTIKTIAKAYLSNLEHSLQPWF